MPTSVKDISASKLEADISKFISDLTGKDCSVSISELKYSAHGFSSNESLSFSASASCKPPKTGEPLPF